MCLKTRILAAAALSAALLALTGCGSGSGGGSSAAPAFLTLYQANANFGSVAVGSTRTMALTFANTGGLPLTLQQNSVSGAGYVAGGLGSTATTLQPGQYVVLVVSFTPVGPGASSGAISLTSSTSAAPVNVNLSGTGITPVHEADLAWDPSTSLTVGYNVYRNSIPDGGWRKLNSAPVTTTAYNDWDAQTGVDYLYSVRAVNTADVESDFPPLVSVSIP